MLKIYKLLVLMSASYCLGQYLNKTGKSYYFRMGKTDNNSDFKVHNRVYFLNHNITDYDFTHKRVENTQSLTIGGNFDRPLDSTYFIDEEWNFNHESIAKMELPLFIHKIYEKTTSNITTTTRIIFNDNRNTSSNIIKFNLDSLKRDELVIDAEFYFFWPLESNSSIHRESVVLRLYQFQKSLQEVFNESSLTENPDIHKLFNVIYISKAQKGWQIFKIKKPIDNWLNGEDNLGLLLTISSYSDNKLISVFNDTNEGKYRSFAIVTVQNSDTLSVKHEINKNNDIQQSTPSCQKKEWTVSFKRLHWDNFIIAPDGFMAYDCVGKCFNSQSDQLNHVKLIRVFNKRVSCCVPVQYLPLPVMFYDKLGNIVIKNYENMIVTRCGCR